MRTLFIILFLISLGSVAGAQEVFHYSCDVMPEDVGFVREGTNDAIRWIEDGWLHQDIRGYGPEPNNGVFDGYRYTLSDYKGAERFYAEWVVETDGPRSEIVGVAPAVFVLSGDIGINYHFTIARDQMRFVRDNRLPIYYFEYEPDVPHKHRIELYGPHWYAYLIDDEVVDAGRPEGTYPTEDSNLIWAGRYYLTEHMTRWDYVEWGEMAEPTIDCDAIELLKSRCNRKGVIKARIKSSLPANTELRITNEGQRETLRLNRRGKAKIKYENQTGEHTILLLDCPAISQDLECGG